MSEFRRLPEHQLSLLSNDDLVAYIVAALEAGDEEAARTANGVLAFGLEPMIRFWVRKAPAQEVDDIVQEVLASVVVASFDGKVLGQFGAFVRRISHRRVADYYRGEGRRIPTEPLGSEHEGEEGFWGNQPVTPEETGLVDLRDVVEGVLATRGELHQKVIRLYGSAMDGFEDLPADQVKARIDRDDSGDTVSIDNVAKIWQRFRDDVRKALDG